MSRKIEHPADYITEFCRCLGVDAQFSEDSAVWLINDGQFGLTAYAEDEWGVESYRMTGGSYYERHDRHPCAHRHGAFTDLRKALRMIAFLLVRQAFEVADEGDAFDFLEKVE